jgi:hypothetical protein
VRGHYDTQTTMPLLGFRPTKARLVMENGKESVLVMRVVLDDDDAVELAAGGSLAELGGVLRIRERRANGNNGRNDKTIGSLVYVNESGRDAQATPAKFQVNVVMSSEKFATLLRVANAGRLPAKFIIEAGARSGAEAKAFRYRKRSGVPVKVWDNHAFRVLPVNHFVMILPIDLPPVTTGAPALEPSSPAAPATNARVAELMDDMLVFQSDTRNTMFGLVCVLAIVALASLALGLAVFFR